MATVESFRATAPVARAVYDDILIPTDGSEPAARAAEHGVDIAERYGATVHAVHVLGMVFSSAGADQPDVGYDAPWADIQRGAEAAASHLTDDVVARCEDRGVDVTARVLRGIHYDRLLDEIDDHGIDLVAMGTHGRRGVERFVLGSVTEKVLRGADASVLTVGSDAPMGDDGYGTVLVGVDGREHTAPAVEQAVDVAATYGADLHAVHVVEPGLPGLPSRPDRRRELGEAALDGAVAAAEEGGVAVERSMREGHPHEELAAAADDVGADLAVVGSGRAGLSRMLLGDVTQKVVRTVDAPVLTAKRSDD